MFISIHKSGIKKIQVMLSVFMLVCLILPGIVRAQSEEQVVDDFANYLLNLLTGPISKIVAGLILITGVVNLLSGRKDVALYCAFAFLVLIFVPQLLEAFRG